MHGLILAGGAARRMGGGDKPLAMLGGQTMLDRIIARLAPQIGALAISANGDPARFARFGLPVLPDPFQGNGPLGGILAGLLWAQQTAGTALLVVPGDTPFLPPDLAARLADAPSPLAYASSLGRAHPSVARIPTALASDLAGALGRPGSRAVLSWMQRHGAVAVEWDAAAGDPFQNVNTPQDLARAATRLS